MHNLSASPLGAQGVTLTGDGEEETAETVNDMDSPQSDAAEGSEGGDVAEPAGPCCPRVPFQCPLNCGVRGWQQKTSLITHCTNHLQESPDAIAVLASWAPTANRWICPTCRTLPALGRTCPKCNQRQAMVRPVQAVGDPVHPPEETLPDSLWENLLSHPLPVVRTIPEEARSQWFLALAAEIDAALQAPSAGAGYRLAAFVRIYLAPTGRGGRRHSRQAAAVVIGRISRCAAGQQTRLAQEYLVLALKKPSGPGRDSGIAEEILPDSVRLAALRAVRDGNLSKAARVLSENVYSLPVDCLTALQDLHPAAPPPKLPDMPAIIGDDFSIEEIKETMSSFPPGQQGASLG